MGQYPLHFRREEVYEVMSRFKVSESASLVGVGSIGKSNLLRHIIDPDTQAHYLGERASRFRAIMIDPNLFGALDDTSDQFRCWAGYELLMHRMFLALYPFEELGDDAQNFAKSYRELQDGTNPLYAYMGLRYFELGLDYFFRRGYQIVFLLDEFEDLLTQMPVRFFQTLRGLRDNHKSQLSFLTFSREPIPVLIKRMGMPELALEPFTELFTDNVFFIGPYNTDDALDMLQTLASRNPQIDFSDAAAQFLLFASGGFAGIIRAGFREMPVVGEIGPADVNNMNLIERLASRQRVRTECETIWHSLTEPEKNVLRIVARKHPEDINDEAERAVALLVQKRLLRVDRQTQTLRIEPPVFKFFVSSIV